MSKKITLAIIGRGHWGQIYKKTIDTMDRVVLPEKHIYGKDYRKLTKKNVLEIDGIIIAASTSAHYEIVSYLIKQGFRNILIEKPLTQTYNQAKKLHRLIQTIPDSCVLVGHTLLYDSAYNKMKKIAQKKLGKVLQIEYFSLKTPPIRNATTIQDAGSPPIYLFLNFTKKNPIKISATSKENENIELILEFDNGLRAIANIGSIYPERKRGIVVTGTKGKLELNEFVNPRKLMLIHNNGKKENIIFPITKSSLEQEIIEFVECVITGKKPKTPYDHGMDVVKIVELAEQSLSKKGKTVFMLQ